MALAFLSALCGGCGGAAGAPNEPAKVSPGETAGAGPAPVPLQPTEGGASAPPGLQAIVDAALDDAAARTGVPLSSLVVTSAEAVIWSDGSIGCPMPGIAYTMALVPGHRVLIRAGETTLDYHAGGGQLILCPVSRAIDPLPLQRS